MVTRRAFLEGATVVGMLATTGCLGGAGGAGGSEQRATVSVESHDTFGDILVDSEGMTLYLFTKDSAGSSSCTGGCAESWPPLTVDGDPSAGPDVTASLGTTERPDGTTQVTVAQHPLYYFANDDQPGDTNGQGVGDVWYVVAPDGSKVTEPAEGGSSSGSGYY